MSNNKDTRGSLWRFFIDNARFTYILITGIILLGLVSIITIPKESTPEIDFPYVIVSTVLPGASALDVEELVTNVLESRLQGLSDVDTIESTSSQGFSNIFIQFDVRSDGREKLADTREAVDRALSDLPDDASTPNVQQISFADRPILSMSFSGEYDLALLRTYAEQLQDEIERIPSVSGVRITGAPDDYIEVIIRQESLNQFNVALPTVMQAIAAANSDIPVGTIETSQTLYTVRLDGRISDAEGVRNTAIASQDGTPILVRDIADVRDTQTRPNREARYGAFDTIPQSSISLQVFKRSGEGDIMTIVDRTHDRIASAYASYLPDDVTISIIENDADLIRSDLNQLVTSGGITMLIVLLVLIMFLGWREALLASLVVPITFLMTFIAISQFGYTINFLTLFSLILALGILVDASIVVTESIFKNIKERGEAPYDAVLHTIDEFQKPLITGTLTTVFVFLPMVLIPGIIGKFIEPIPVTVTIVLLSAIFASLAIVTTLGARFLKSHGESHVQGFALTTYTHKAIAYMYTKYDAWIHKILDMPRRGKILLATVSVLFVASIALPVIGVVQVNMFPATPQSVIYFDVVNPEGTPLAITSSQLGDIESLLIEDDRIKSFLTTAGASSDAGSVDSGANSHRGSIVVRLQEHRSINSIDIIAEYEALMQRFPDVEVEISQITGGPPSGAPIEVRIVGQDLDAMYDTAQHISDTLATLNGPRNIDTGISQSSGELVISVNRAQARTFGISPLEIAGVLRTAVSGTTATTLTNEGVDTNVVVRYDISSERGPLGDIPRMSVADLQSILIPTMRGSVPLSTFAQVDLEPSLLAIDHKDGDRIVRVTADIEADANAQNITQQLQRELRSYVPTAGIDIIFAGEAEDVQESFGNLGFIMIIGILLIFGLLVWQFNSYSQPLYVLGSIPLAIIGVLPGLALLGQPFSFPGFIGVVALAGIVVNNAIILIDAINNNRNEGASKRNAIEDAAKSRLQPILLTTITTVAGMIPLAASDPAWAPLAISIIFGLLFSTITTLFVVPILYNLFEK